MKNILVNDIIDLISKLNILELSDLILKIEKKFNLSIEDKKQEKNENFSVFLKEVGDKKISLIKVIKEITKLSLKESKDLVEKQNSLIKSNLKKNECNEIEKKINEVGGKIEIK